MSEQTVNKSTAGKIRSQLLGRFGIFLGLLVLIFVFSMLSPAFFTTGNFKNILIQSGTNAVIAAGMTFVIISAEIDLSVGATLALSSVLGAQVMVQTGSVPLGVVVALLAGIILGLINGVLISYLKFPSFIVTLSTMWLFRGLAYVYTEGQAIVNLPDANMNLALGNILMIPNIVWLFSLVYVISYLILKKFRIGRKIYATGDNYEAARLSGINVKSIKLLVFVISGFMAALAGIILMSRLNSGQPIAGLTFELSAIAAAVVGGTSLTKGGVGSVGGTLIGAMFIATLQNGLVILNVTSFWQQVFMGIVLLMAVAIDRYRKVLAN